MANDISDDHPENSAYKSCRLAQTTTSAVRGNDYARALNPYKIEPYNRAPFALPNQLCQSGPAIIIRELHD